VAISHGIGIRWENMSTSQGIGTKVAILGSMAKDGVILGIKLGAGTSRSQRIWIIVTILGKADLIQIEDGEIVGEMHGVGNNGTTIIIMS
jgi:hypothetical protein